MRAPKVTVVIPSWNGLAHLPECLAALERQTLRDFEVVIVDNASTDNGVEWVRAHHADVRIDLLPSNRGFAAAVNRGILVARGQFVALLNNDAVPEPRWLEALVDALERRREYSFAASLLVFYADPGRVNAAGDTYDILRLVGRNRGFGRPSHGYREVKRVLGACAGAALYRRTLFAEVGPFDEDFFLMSEDTDFNLRCLVAGKRCLYVPEARVRHKFRASIDAQPEWPMMRLAYRNEAMVAAKDLPAPILVLLPILWPWRLLRETVLRRPESRRSPFLQVRRAPLIARAELSGFRLGVAKRGDVWRRQVASQWQIVRWLVKGTGPA